MTTHEPSTLLGSLFPFLKKLSLRTVLLATLKRVISFIPPSLRLYLYKHRAAKEPYGDAGFSACLKIFPHIWVKWGPRTHIEAESIYLVRRHTSIPVPIVLDVVADSPKGIWYMLMTEIPGQKFPRVMDDLTPDDMTCMVAQLRDWLRQLREIPSPYGSAVCGVNHTGIVSYRWSGRPQGPFATIFDLHRWMFRSFTSEELEDPEMRQAVSTLNDSPRKLCYTHGDLLGWNVLVQNGKLSGIVDWECAAWLPDYWEYSAPHYPRGLAPANKWQQIVRAAMNNYDSEVHAELQVWKRRDFGLGF